MGRNATRLKGGGAVYFIGAMARKFEQRVTIVYKGKRVTRPQVHRPSVAHPCRRKTDQASILAAADNQITSIFHRDIYIYSCLFSSSISLYIILLSITECGCRRTVDDGLLLVARKIERGM